MDIQSDNINLCRIGKPNDGGYVMVYPFSSNNVAYSLGICNDVSWDLQMAEDGYSIYQYDHTIDKLPENNKAFHWKKEGVTGEKENARLKHLETLIKENGHEGYNGMLLKMDIEGHEWKVLNSIELETLKKFDQIVVELHGLVEEVPLHENILNVKKEEILSALKRITQTHQLVYLHANNNVKIGMVDFNGPLITPNLLEATFVLRSKYQFKESELVFPTELDQPNNLFAPEIYLGKWNV